MLLKKQCPGTEKVKITGSNSTVLSFSESTCGCEDRVTKDQVNVRMKQDVGALGMNERSVLTIGSFEGQGGFVWMTEVQK